MDPNQQNAPDGSSQAPYPTAGNRSYQGQQIMYGTQGQAYMFPYQGQSFMYGTQGACSGGLNMPMMQPSANVQQPDACNGDDEADVVEVTNPPAAAPSGKGSRSRSSNFSNVEDVYLVKSRLEISTDATVGTGQKKDRLWHRILERYNLRRESSGNQVRTMRSLQSRWDIIKAEVGKFASFYADCVRENRSGTSDADKTTHAAATFGAVLGHNFSFMHCWEIMKDAPKWQDPKSRASTRSAAGEGFGEDSLNCSPTKSVERRPMGREAAKAAKKKPNSSAGSTSSEYASKMQDLCLQQTVIMQTDSERKQNHYQQLASLEDQRFQEMQRHNQSLLIIEKEKIDIDKEKVRLMREKQDQDKEEKEKQQEERILAIDLDACRPSQREYYEGWQQEILEKQRARRGK